MFYHVNKQLNKGFTLVEIIIVVAVMSLLLTMSFPALISFIQKRDEESEKLIQAEIAKAVNRYYVKNNTIPSDTASNNPGNEDWYDLLASLTNLSGDNIRYDTWGNERRYVSYIETETLLDSDFDIGYVSIHSRGADRELTNARGVAVNSSGDFAPSTNGGWWKNRPNPTNAFANLESDGDDIYIKYTNRQNVMGGYEETLNRMGSLSKALESYAQAKYLETMIAEPTNDNIHLWIYYPRSNSSGGLNLYGASSNTDRLVLSDMDRFDFGGDNQVANSNNDTVRRAEMIELMRLLGLPDNHCCSALERDSNGEEKALFYFSNPRPRSSGCGSRPGVNDPVKLPPRITTKNDSNTCG